MTQTTTILGKVYQGRPMMGSVALRCHRLEQDHGSERAQAYLDSINRRNNTFQKVPPHDLQEDMTLCRMEGAEIYAPRPTLKAERCEWRISNDQQSGRFAA